MTEWDFIKQKINTLENYGLAMDGSVPIWSSKQLMTLINNFEQQYKDKYQKQLLLLGKQYSSRDYIIITEQEGDFQKFIVKKRK